MECRLTLNEEEWKLLLKMLHHERQEMSTLIRRMETAEPRRELHAKRDMVDHVIDQVEMQLTPA